LRRSRLLLALVLPLLTVLAVPSSAAKPVKDEPTTSANRPILFVHGYNSSASTWDTMVSNFQAAGWTDNELYRWSYNTRQSNVITADEVAARVDDIRAKTGWDKVDVIAHSMGSLSSRYYLKNLGGDVKVDDWISLGGPNHGTDTANFCFDTSCYEMRIGSAFLTDLNSGDESPGTPAYATYWSPCDTVINPDSSVSVSGATNNQTACISHSALTTDSTVFSAVKSTVEG
jgi:triacylglycerol lipase